VPKGREQKCKRREDCASGGGYFKEVNPCGGKKKEKREDKAIFRRGRGSWDTGKKGATGSSIKIFEAAQFQEGNVESGRSKGKMIAGKSSSRKKKINVWINFAEG